MDPEPGQKTSKHGTWPVKFHLPPRTRLHLERLTIGPINMLSVFRSGPYCILRRLWPFFILKSKQISEKFSSGSRNPEPKHNPTRVENPVKSRLRAHPCFLDQSIFIFLIFVCFSQIYFLVLIMIWSHGGENTLKIATSSKLGRAEASNAHYASKMTLIWAQMNLNRKLDKSFLWI